MKTSGNGEIRDRWIYALIGFCCVMAAALALFRYFDHDELEHIHCAWYVLQGKIPYRDFFQNHNPVLWYVIAPFIYLLGEGTAVMFLSRAVMLLSLAGIALSVRNISREAGASAREANYAILFVLSCSTLLNKSIEVRPDIPQVFFGLLSCLYFLKYLKDRKPLQMTISGFWAGVSFVVLQKSVFLFGIAGISLLWLLIRKAATWRAPLLYALGSVVPIAVLAMYLVSTGSFGDYFLTNWALNMNQLKTHSPLDRMFHSLIENPAFWSLAMLSLWTCFFRKRGGPALQMVTLWGMLLLGCLFLFPRPQYQYFIFPLALLAIPASRQLAWVFERFRCSTACRIGVLVLAFAAPWSVTAFRLTESNRPQLQMIRYVLNGTAPGDRIYDGDIQFNLYRPDLHYFWYNVKPKRGLDSYNRVSGNRFSNYDIHALIEAKKPVFISAESVDFNDPRIRGMYARTPFPHLYRLRN